MRDALDSLTTREKETLQLLLAGHDAKSIARAQGLSVHTVNERLRSARRKLGASSSRQAARMMAGLDPDFFGNTEFGVSQPAGRWIIPVPAGGRLAVLTGGILVMSIVVAATLLVSSWLHPPADQTDRAQAGARAVAPNGGERSVSAAAARQWAALVDAQDWDASWATAAELFKAQVSAAQWARVIGSVRNPLGRVVSRQLVGATRTATLPGAPAGDYEMLQFQTNFAARSGAIETLVMKREGANWKVAGYFIK